MEGQGKGEGEVPLSGKGTGHLKGQLNCGLLAGKWRENMRALWNALAPDIPYPTFMNLSSFLEYLLVFFVLKLLGVSTCNFCEFESNSGQ